MPPPRKRLRSRSPQGPQMPMRVFNIVSSFIVHFIDVTAPCSAGHSSPPTPTMGIPRKPCWIVDNLTRFNKVLNTIGLELDDYELGQLQLRSIFRKRKPDTQEDRETAAFIVKLLLNNHHCVQEVNLNYLEKLLAGAHQPISEICPTAAVRSIAIRGERQRSPELKMLVRVMLRGDPCKLVLRGISFGATEIAALIRSMADGKRLTELTLTYCGLSISDILRLLEVIKNYNTIKDLHLCAMPIGVRGAQRLAKLLVTNTSLLSLALVQTKIKDQGAVAISRALLVNNTLERLTIADKSIGPTAGECIGASLSVNKSLISLHLYWNFLDSRGGPSIAQVPRSVRPRGFYWVESNLGDIGIAAIAKALENNRTLAELSIPGGELGGNGVAALTRLVVSNNTLKQLQFRSMSRDIWPAQFHAFTNGLALNRSLECVCLDFPCTRTLSMFSEALRRNETIRDLSISALFASEASVLFDALTVNHSVREFKFRSSISAESAEAFARLLRTTSTLRTVTVLSSQLRERPLAQLIVDCLATNTSIWKFSAFYFILDTEVCRRIAGMLVENKTLNTFDLGVAVVREVNLRTLAEGLFSNKYLGDFLLKYRKSSFAGLNIKTCLRRNRAILNCAVQFALKKVKDKDSATAFQLYHRSEFFVHKLLELPEVPTASSAVSTIRQANDYILENFFMVSGVVDRFVECSRPCQGTVATLIDNLNCDCMRKIASYLKVSDVKS